MALKDIFKQLGVSGLESDTDTKTETSEVVGLNEENQITGEGNGKPQDFSTLPDDAPKDIATASSRAGSPQIPAGILPLSFFATKSFDPEDNHKMAKGKRKPKPKPKPKPKAKSRTTTAAVKAATDNASPDNPPKLPMGTIMKSSAKSFKSGDNDDEDQNSAPKRNEKHSPAITGTLSKSSAGIVWSASSPKLSFGISKLPFESLNGEDKPTTSKDKDKSEATSNNIVATPEIFPDSALEIDLPEMASEVSATSTELSDGEGFHETATSNKKTATISDVIAATSQPSTISSIGLPKPESEVPSSSTPSLDKKRHNMTGSSKSKATPGAVPASSTTSPIRTPKIASKTLLPPVQSLEKQGQISQQSKETVFDATETPPILAVLATSNSLPTGPIQISLKMPTLPVQPLSQVKAAIAEDETNIEDAPERNSLALHNHVRTQPSGGTPVQHTVQDDFEEDSVMPGKKQIKSKSSKKKKKPAAANTTPSNSTPVSSGGTSTTPRMPSITAQADPTSRASTSSNIATMTTSEIAAPATSLRPINLALTHRFGFDQYRDELKCRKHECWKLTNCYDGSTVICPRCGVNSYLRYCSLDCLLDPDMAYHWATECGTCPIPATSLPLVDQSTLIVRPAAMRPYVSCNSRDNPARHRQAVYHSSNGAAGDYFVFNDHSIRPEGLTGQVTTIGLGEVIAVVSIVPDLGLYQGHTIFQEILEDCLRTGHTRADKCLALVDLITKQLAYSHQWSQEVVECLAFQVRNEFGYEIPQEMVYRFSMVQV